MEIKLLPKSVRETLRSEVNIRSIAKAVAQLVFNSLDAKAVSVAIRVNLVTFKIQVIDNGTGISKQNLKLIGYRYATSKYYTVEYLEKNPNILPSRGECLASIIKLSEIVKITSRCENNPKTYCKTFEKGKSLKTSSVKHRPSVGTTIIIENFMYNLPVRKKSVNPNISLEEIRNEIEYIALIHPNVSFSLRNDTNGEIIFHTYRTKFVFQTAAILYGKEFTRKLRKIGYNVDNFSFSGLISLDSHPQNRIQFVYINNKFVGKTKIHEMINKLISKSKIIKNKEKISESPILKQKHGAYIVNLKCPYSELDIIDYIEPEIEFKNWKDIQSCVENALIQFFKKYDLIEIKEPKNNFQNGSPITESLPKVRVSQNAGVIRGIPMKRKLPEEKIEQVFTPVTNDKEQTQIVIADVHPPPKKTCTDSVIRELSLRLKQDINKQSSPLQKPEINNKIIPLKNNLCIETIPKQLPVRINKQEVKQNLNKTLESNSECGKSLILNKFLKSTLIFRGDDDLNMELIKYKEKDNHSSSSCVLTSYKKCKTTITTATKISVTKTIEHNNNINNLVEDTLFKVPTAAVPRKRKKSQSNSADISYILARDRAINQQEQQLALPTNFELDFINNVCRKKMPSNVPNHFCRIFNDIAKKSRSKSYKCTIKYSKKEEYLQSSDFLKPAQRMIQRIPERKIYKNSNIVPLKHKEIVHSNSMLKTFYDIKENYERHPQIICRKLEPEINNIYSTSSKYKHLNPLFKSDNYQNFLPIYNIKNNGFRPYHLHNHNKKDYLYQNPIEKNFQNQRNRLYIPSPVVSFKPFSSNPNFTQLFRKSNFSHKKPIFNCTSKSFLNNKQLENDLKSQNSIGPTFDSHLISKYSKKQSKSKPKILQKDSKELTNIVGNNFCFNNEQNNQVTITKDNLIPGPSKKKLKTQNPAFNKIVDETPVTNSKDKIVNENKKQISFNFEPRNIVTNNTQINYDNIQSRINLNNKKFDFSCLSTTSQNNNNENKTLAHPILSNSLSKSGYNNKIDKSFNCYSLLQENRLQKSKNNENIIINDTKSSERFNFSWTATPENENNANKSQSYQSLLNSVYKLHKEDKNNATNISPHFSKQKQAQNINSVETNNKIKSSERFNFSWIGTPENNNYANKSQSYESLLNSVNKLHKFEEKSNATNTSPHCSKQKHSQDINNAKTNNNIKNDGPFNFCVVGTPVNNNNKDKLQSLGSSRNINTCNNEVVDTSLNCSFMFKDVPEKSTKSNKKNIKSNNRIESITKKSDETKKNLNLSSKEGFKKISKSSYFSFVQNKNDSIQEDNNIKVDQSITFLTNSSPILGSRISLINTAKQKQNQGIPKQNFGMVSNFSSTSNLIEEKNVTNIINVLDQSILNYTLTNLRMNILENNQDDLKRDIESKQTIKVSSISSGSNSGGPIFLEDSSNVIKENYKTIDEILNLNDQDTNKTQKNDSKISHNHESHNLQSNSLSKNVEESTELQDNAEYGNQISEWENLSGNCYLNARTGMTCFGTPKNIDGCLITKRHSFMPKGMSPILFNTSKAVTKQLSQNSKNILHQTIANTENDELQTVKWMNFFQNRDSEQFFNDLYCNDKNYELEISNLNSYSLPKKLKAAFENYSFSKDDFKNITVINQCDSKFIVTTIQVQEKYNLLVFFDQHAVHERIRLEKLLKDYEENDDKLKSIKCKTPIKLTVESFDMRMLKNYKHNFENWGLFYEIKDKSNVIFTSIPLCWQVKDDSNVKNKDYSSIETLIMTLIQEESNWLRNIKSINVAYPICIQNAIKTEACRTAVKFGDPLSKEQCEDLIKDLFLCELPFNCAHGRPTLHPIVDLNHLNDDDEDEEIDLSKLMD